MAQARQQGGTPRDGRQLPGRRGGSVLESARDRNASDPDSLVHMSSDGLRVTFLGTGTSVGIPVLTCDCHVCTSEDPRNRRLRASLLLEWPSDEGAEGTYRVLVDTSTDLRQQALRASIRRIDAVVFTHGHADHVLGLDELRMYNFVHRSAIPLYGDAATLAAVRRMFAYAFEEGAVAVPRLITHEMGAEVLLGGRRIQAIAVQHGAGVTQALRVGDFAYITDCNGISEDAASRLQGLDVLVIDALRRKPHRSHFSLSEALEQVARLAPRRAFLTHLSHEFEHGALLEELPAGVEAAYDGLVLELPDPAPRSPA